MGFSGASGRGLIVSEGRSERPELGPDWPKQACIASLVSALDYSCICCGIYAIRYT